MRTRPVSSSTPLSVCHVAAECFRRCMRTARFCALPVVLASTLVLLAETSSAETVGGTLRYRDDDFVSSRATAESAWT